MEDVGRSKVTVFFFFLYATYILCVITGFRREMDENCTLLGYYAESSGNFLPTFRGNQSVPSSEVKNNQEERSS